MLNPAGQVVGREMRYRSGTPRVEVNPTDPQSFNRYAYVQNDPVNFFTR